LLGGVEVAYFKAPALGGFKEDYIRIAKAPQDAGGGHPVDGLKHLWFDFVEGDLAAKGAARLTQYLERLQIWRKEAEWPVYLAGNGPYLAFTARVYGSHVEIILLGAMLAFQDVHGDAWWDEVILPRLRTIWVDEK
jgi:hypothetical protein